MSEGHLRRAGTCTPVFKELETPWGSRDKHSVSPLGAQRAQPTAAAAQPSPALRVPPRLSCHLAS